MLCPNCNSYEEESNVFCSNCGKPLPNIQANQNALKPENLQYDLSVNLTAKKDTAPIFTGLIMLVGFPLIVQVRALPPIGILGLILLLRFIGILWTILICKSKNRPTLLAGVFGFLAPSVTLIVVALQAAKSYPQNYNELPPSQRSSINLDLAIAHYNAEYFHQAKLFFEIAEKENPKNAELEEVRADILS